MNKIDLMSFKAKTEDSVKVINNTIGIRAGRAIGFNNTLQRWIKYFMGSDYGDAGSITNQANASVSAVRSKITNAILIANEKLVDIQSDGDYADVEKFKNCTLVSLSQSGGKLNTVIKFETVARTTEGALTI